MRQIILAIMAMVSLAACNQNNTPARWSDLSGMDGPVTGMSQVTLGYWPPSGSPGGSTGNFVYQDKATPCEREGTWVDLNSPNYSGSVSLTYTKDTCGTGKVGTTETWTYNDPSHNGDITSTAP